jgi:hypothetical protein
MRIWPCKAFLFILACNFLHTINSYMGPASLLPLQRKVCCGFLLPLKIHCLNQVLAIGSNGKHTNHYTEVTKLLKWLVHTAISQLYRLELHGFWNMDIF